MDIFNIIEKQKKDLTMKQLSIFSIVPIFVGKCKTFVANLMIQWWVGYS